MPENIETAADATQAAPDCLPNRKHPSAMIDSLDLLRCRRQVHFNSIITITRSPKQYPTVYYKQLVKLLMDGLDLLHHRRQVHFNSTITITRSSLQHPTVHYKQLVKLLMDGLDLLRRRREVYFN